MALSSPVLEKNEVIQDEIILDEKNKRYKKFEKFIETYDFDKLMLRLTYEHNNEYINNCYYQGYLPKPNNKLQFIFDYLIDNYADIIVRQLKTPEKSKVWSFKGYFFQITANGIINVINKDDLTLMITL